MNSKEEKELVVILNNIRSNENVGSIFRTSDAVSVKEIVLCGYTPTPKDRFNRVNKGFVKASLGAEETVKWSKEEYLDSAVLKLKEKGFVIVAVEQNANSIDYKDVLNNVNTNKIALVFGNEVSGLSQVELGLCDFIAELPMKGKKESLNVAVCAGIVLYSIF